MGALPPRGSARCAARRSSRSARASAGTPHAAASPRKEAAMKISEIMTTKPATVGPDATLGEVATLMRQEDCGSIPVVEDGRSEEHTSELQSRGHLVCRLLLEK